MKSICLALAVGLVGASVAAPASRDAGDAATREAKWASVSRRVAAEGAVLLKNERGTLPLSEGASVRFFAGDRFLKCGGGSSDVKTAYEIDLRQGLAEAGFEVDGDDPRVAVVPIVRWSSEGSDPKDEAFELTDAERARIRAAEEACERVVVVLNLGHLINVKPLKDDPKVDAVLFAWFPGQEGGAALADILRGRANPSARLVDTLAERLADYPAHKYFRAETHRLPFGEGVDVGYRYFNVQAKDRIVYPFGYGLSYTTFAEGEHVRQADGSWSVDVKNTGAVPGKYSVLHYENGELAAFAKTSLLKPGASETLVLRPFDPGKRAYAKSETEPQDPEIEALLGKLTLEEKVNLCSAQPPAVPRGTAGIGNLPRHGIPNAQTADGPNGIRRSGTSTCYPSSVMLAQSFDLDLAHQVGQALGEEAAAHKVDILLGPGLNIHRHPLCGRTFEYFSEDPLVSGRMAAAYVRGVQSTGTAATLKHFCCNSREWWRYDYTSDVDENVLRNIYLKGFEIAVKEGRPRCVMTAYNKVNGDFAGECGWLINGILRGEWGFDGLVMTDWRAKSEIYRQIPAGCDVNMPFGYPEKVDLAIAKVKDGTVPLADLDACVRRVLREVRRSHRFRNGDFGEVTPLGPTGETVVPAKTSVAVSSTWTFVDETAEEGWCHAGLGKDPRGNDTFVQYELEVAETGTYAVVLHGRTDNPDIRVSYEVEGMESSAVKFASVDAWQDLPSVVLRLPKGRQTLRVWFRNGKPLDWTAVHGAAFSRLTFRRTTESPVLDLSAFRAAWAAEKDRVAADIRANRMSEVTVSVKGRAPGDVIEVRQISHDFKFGSNCLVLGQLKDPEKARAYEAALKKLFNLVTTTACLGVYEKEPGKFRFEDNGDEDWRRPPMDRIAAWSAANGIACKGQPLLAGSWHPDWAKGQTIDEAHAMYVDYFTRVARRYGDRYAMFDVVNEAFCHHNFPLYTNDWSFVDWALETAGSLFPTNVSLCINEYSAVNGGIRDFRGYWDRSGDYYGLAKRVLDKGLRLDGLGFQFHMFTNDEFEELLTLKRWTPQELRRNYDRYATLGIPLYITEVTIPSTLGGTADGEKLQAEVAEDLYRFWFSQKAFAGITWWNLCDGAAWLKEGDVLAGLLDAEMREKPVYQTLYQLIKREWTTRLSLKVSAEGTVTFRGFHGDYLIAGEKVHVGPNDSALTVGF